ncbi:MAG TPA: DNA mismatch repair endonuclease MutL [Thermoplasmata archaeon]|nr:DNA mismatch repair endonuclease MutL [Thermoplasmata archaeon]
MSAGGRRPIRRLEPRTIERIAAGEVVERPASVAKELVENAIDAGAQRVSVRLDGGGLERIVVEDDGEGIPPEELGLAVERHATSKLAPDGPIDAIATLGFRGEALASIASVARVRLLSRPAGEEVGHGIRIEGGEVAGRFQAPRAPGTTVEVADLFYRTPARRKFLKSPAAEQLEIVRTLARVYLARPSVALRVSTGDLELAVYPASVRLTDAAARVLGPEAARGAMALDAPVPGGRIEGCLGAPASGAATSTGLYLSVNGRAVISRSIPQAVRAAYGDSMPRARFPVGVLAFTIGRDGVDVNVHPTKREVRFARERELLDALRVRVREALIEAPAPSEAPLGRPSPAGRARMPPPPLTAARSSLVQARLDVSAGRSEPALVAAPARWELLGCVDRLYWVALRDGGLVLVDQHAASERLLFDELRRDGRLARQQLVAPVAVTLTALERATLAAESEAVTAAGFDVEGFGPEAALVRAVPSYRVVRAAAAALAGLLDELADGVSAGVGPGAAERRAATIACHAAIRAGDEIEPATMGAVLAALDAEPGRAGSCPHGRPIFLALPRARLDRWFLRSGA